MPTPPLPLAALLLGLLGAPGSPAEGAAPAEVVAGSLALHVEPDAASVVTERLRKGDRVRVVDPTPSPGWVAVEPPAGAFGWVAETSVRETRPGQGRVVAPRAVVRAGVPDARMPGPPRTELPRGAVVRFLDRPPLVLGAGRDAAAWLAVALPPGEVCYVRAAGVAPPDPSPNADPAPEVRAAYEPGATPTPAEELARIEAEHRAALAESVDRWDLRAVRDRYRALLGRTTDPAAAVEVRRRLDLVARHEEVARSARTFQTLVDRSRRRDQEVSRVRRRLAEADRSPRRAFVAEGLIQPTSRLVDGHRVYALIGPEGAPVAYLDLPPGLDASPVLRHRAGVRGSVHFSEALGARLIAVRDLEPLD